MNSIIFFASNLVILAIVGNNIAMFDKYIYNANISAKRHISMAMLFAISLSVVKMGMQHSTDNLLKAAFKLSVYVIAFALIYFVLRLKFWRAVFIFCVTLVSMALGESIVLSAFMLLGRSVEEVAYGDNLMLYFIGNLFINIFQLLILQVIKVRKSIRLLAKGIKNTTYRNLAINMLSSAIAMVLTIFMIGFTVDSTKHLVVVVYGTMTILTVLCNILAIRMVINVDFRDEKLKMQEEYNEILVDLKHKFFGIMSIFTALVNDGNIEKLREYTNEINKGFIERMKNIPTNIKNNKLFYLIAMKSGEAHDKGVALKVVIPYEINEITGVNEDTYVYIVNELLSNAIEHSEGAKTREVFIKVENLNDCIKTVVENSVGIKQEGDKKVGRGNGLKQISKMLNNNSYFKVSYNEMFTAELIVTK